MDSNIMVHNMEGELTKVHEVTGGLSQTGEVTGALSVPESRTVAARYPDLRDKPSINQVTIEGDKGSEDYHLQGKMEYLTQQEIERILYIDD